VARFGVNVKLADRRLVLESIGGADHPSVGAAPGLSLRSGHRERAKADHPMSRASRDAVDWAVWRDPEMRAALAARDIAMVYRRLQRVGISQRRIAALTGQSQSEISEILGGRRVVAYDVLVRIADGLGIPRAWMGLAQDDSVPLSAAEDVDEDLEDVNRRTVLRAGVAIAAVPLVGAVLPPALPRTFLPDVAARLGAVMLPIGVPPAAADARSIDKLTAGVNRAWELRQRAQYAALGELLASLIRDVDHAIALRGADQPQVHALGVHAYNAASSLLKKLGDCELALMAADRALRLASSLEDPLLIAAAAYRLANVFLAARRHVEARRVALDAADVIEPAKMQTARSLALWGGPLLTAAVAAARAADESGAWEILGEARAASRLLGADHADMYSIFGPTNVAIHGVQIAVELGDGRVAVQRGQRVDPEALPASLVERRAQFLIDLAHGHLLDRDHGQALAVLLHAERTAPQEVRLSHDVQGLVRTLLHEETTGSSSEARELAERVGITD
jgi:transcriptional regulator with XRE-family HTH domain